MNKKTIFIFVNGINTVPSKDSNWNAKAVTYINTKTPHKAEKLEYFCSFITRAFHNKKRARKLYRMLSFYKGYKINIVGHSNGVDLILDCLNFYNDWPDIANLHLVCGAGQRDFNKNGLNELLKDGRIGKTKIYVAGRDFMLKLANTWFGKVLGYGNIGQGAQNIDNSIKNKVKTISDSPWDNYAHSECWNDENFEETMELFI